MIDDAAPPEPSKDSPQGSAPESRPDAPAPARPSGARKSDPGAAERLAAALRENLRRRKQQARARRSGEDAPPEGETPPAKG
jgi:hypothetical protein